MFEAVMMAATGLRHQQRRMDSIADNLANVNTAGFKAERLDFKDALYTNGIIPGPAYTPEGNQQKGHGVLIAAVTREFTTGSPLPTGNKFDFMIEGKGYFSVEDKNGETRYTRAGGFYSADGGGVRYLVNANRYFVLDENGERITVPENTYNVQVGHDGTMSFTHDNGEETTVKLGIYTFRNETGLVSVGNSHFAESAVSGERMAGVDGHVTQGSLENSNVSLATEFTRLLRTQRAFQLASRALTTADDMEGIANNIRK